MADRGRDFKVSILSDADRFDLSRPADELERLGDAAKASAKDLDRSTERMEKSIDAVGDEAKATAAKVDSAFDRIAKSSKSSMRKTGDSLDDFKDEAADTGREAAASFSGGFEDIVDAVQEIGANAFAKLGKVGMAGGILAAGALGLVVTKAQEATEKVNDLRDTFFDFMKTNVGSSGPTNALKEFMDALDAEQLQDFGDALNRTGADKEKFFRAMSGDTAALADVRRELEGMIPAFNMPWDMKATEAQHLLHALGDAEKGMAGASVAADTYKDALQGIGPASEGVAEALSRVGDQSGIMAGAIETAAQRQADATKTGEDSWTDYKNTAIGSIDEVIAKQLDIIAAHANLEANTQVVFDRLGQAAVDWANSQGDAADEAMQLLANAPLEKGKQVVANYLKTGEMASNATARGMESGRGRAAAAAGRVHQSMADRLNDPITVPVNVEGPSAAEVAAIHDQIKRRFGTVTIPTNVQYGAGRLIP